MSTDWFFNYFRQRAANAAAVANLQVPEIDGFPGRAVAEQLILVTAGIEALAGYWDRMFSKQIVHGGARVVAFLEAHGEADVWSRVSLPPLVRYARKQRAKLVPALLKLPKARTPPAQKRDFRDDPTWDELITHLRKELPSLNTGDLPPFRYSHILYTQYRCAWVHGLSGPGSGASMWSNMQGDEPWYDNWSAGPRTFNEENDYGTRRVLVLPVGLLSNTYSRAIDSLHRAVDAAGIDPDEAVHSRDPWGMAK